MFSAPMGATDITADCSPGPRVQGFYELRAKGGAAAVTVSELVVHPDTDGSHMLHLNLETVGNLAAHTFVADAIRRHGAVPSIEFSHSGQYAGTYMADKNKKASLNQWGPSDGVRPDGKPVKSLSKEQIKDIVKAYGEAAILSKRAGYEMIMVHSGHGWLLSQFLSPFFNHRTDEYGGNLENRVRIVREVLEAVRAGVGPGFPIELRMSGSELFEGGYTLEDGCKIAEALEDLVDLFHVSAGSYQFGFFNTHLPMFADHGANVYLAAEIKKHVSKPVAAIGALNDPAQMERILEEGKADVIYMARELLADPFLPRKVEAGEEDRIVKCLRCFTCMSERPTTFTRRCAVNPLVGRELEGMDITPATKKKKVLVAGAGVAGLKAAITAAQRGHQVILCDKETEVGGILKSEVAIPFKREMYELGLSLERQAKDEGVQFRLGTLVTPEYVATVKPDALILAVGSKPIVPPLPGIDGLNVVKPGLWEDPLTRGGFRPFGPQPEPDGLTLDRKAGDFNPFTCRVDMMYPQTRWVEVLQNDFAARADWCIKLYEDANHAPSVMVTHLDISAKPGETVSIKANASDPDGDGVDISFWQYREAGTSDALLEIHPDGTFDIPADAVPGTTLHVIVQATDSGSPSLTRFQRVIVTVL